MKKVIRMTESDLTKLVQRVIKEQLTNQKIDYKVLEKFLMGIDDGGTRYSSNWVLDSANPGKRSGSVILRDQIMMRTSFVNKPLVWSLMVNGKKEKGAIFQIFSVNGKLYYQCYSSYKSGQQNTSAYEEITSATVGSAIEKFNQRVSM